MARTAEQYSVTDEDGEQVFIADDVNGIPGAAGLQREIILMPSPKAQVQRAGQSAEYLDAEEGRAWGQGNRMQRFELVVARTFDTLANAILFADTHEGTIPSLGELTLRHSFGSHVVESVGFFQGINVNPAETYGVRVQVHYQWFGTPWSVPEAQ